MGQQAATCALCLHFLDGAEGVQVVVLPVCDCSLRCGCNREKRIVVRIQLRQGACWPLTELGQGPSALLLQLFVQTFVELLIFHFLFFLRHYECEGLFTAQEACRRDCDSLRVNLEFCRLSFRVLCCVVRR